MAITVEHHMSDTDAFTMQLERDPLLRSTVVAVALLDRTPDWQVLQDRVERATRLAPTFRQNLNQVPRQLAPPRWVLDTDFDRDPAALGPLPEIPVGRIRGLLLGDMADAVTFNARRVVTRARQFVMSAPGSLVRATRHPVDVITCAGDSTKSSSSPPNRRVGDRADELEDVGRAT